MTDVADKANEDNEAIATEDAKLDEADEANEIVEAAEANDFDEVKINLFSEKFCFS